MIDVTYILPIRRRGPDECGGFKPIDIEIRD